jgi:hypothetical protein
VQRRPASGLAASRPSRTNDVKFVPRSVFVRVQKEQVLAALTGSGGARAGLAAALQSKLDSLVGRSSGFVESLPMKVRDRIEKLNELQGSYDELEEKFQVRICAHANALGSTLFQPHLT